MTQPNITLEERYCAHNYAPLPVVLKRGEGVCVWDTEGNRYFDLMSAYSAVSHGHCHPRLVAALTDQAKRLGVISRAFYSDLLGPFVEKACKMTGMGKALPMNSGAEAVETAIKAARKWGYTKKGIPDGKAEIIVCDGNFHGRTITIVGFSSEHQYKRGFGPFPHGFVRIPYGDIDVMKQAIHPNTAAVLLEPIQGEGGIILPPKGYLKKVSELCKKNNILLLCDEIQTGLGRTGTLLASDHEDVKPDGLMLGKALGGGLLPISLFLAREDVMEVFTPGDHGSTFGGNPLACRVGLEALNIIEDDQLVEHSRKVGDYFLSRLKEIKSPLIEEVRGRGLFIGLQLNTEIMSSRAFVERLARNGILSKETHETVIRLAPPLIINRQQINEVMDRIKLVISEVERRGYAA